jgi:hypothetical protein
MKKLNKLLLVCFVLVMTTNYAQTNKYGFRAGVGIPNLKSTDNNIYSKDYESVPGFDGSFFADFGITEHFSIKAELGFSRKGGERNGVQPIPVALLGPLTQLLPPGQPVWAQFDNKAVFNYIEIPILAKYEWDLGKTWGVYVNAGPYVDFIIKPEQVTSGTSSFYFDETMTMPVMVPYPIEGVPPAQWPMVELPPQDLTATTDINSDLSNMDFGAMFGIGITAAISENSEILFDMRGSYGFVPLQSDIDTYGTVHMGNLTFALGYAYTFPSKVQATPVKE